MGPEDETPVVDHPWMNAAGRVMTTDEIKNMTMAEYRDYRERLLAWASRNFESRDTTVTLPPEEWTLTCMWCAMKFPRVEELEAHEEDCVG